MDRFDEIMENCPFLKQVILDKIASEISKKDAEIATIKEEAQNRINELETAILELAGVIGGEV